MVEALALGALGLVGYAAISRRTADSVLTAPMWFTALGYLGAHLLGHDLDLHMQANWVHLVAEIALVVVLLVDASQIDLARLRLERALPIRLLGLGLPLTIALGAVGARLVFKDMSWWEAGLIASILAPTDAALGQAVISNPAVPERIRQALGVESGLNDGIALPVVLLCLYAFELEHAHGSSAGYWTRFVSMQLLLGPLVGAAVGALGGWLVTAASRAGWMTRGFQQLSLVGLAVLSFALAEVLGGNGFLAAFVGGLVLGNTAREASRRVVEFGETEGQLLCAVTFMTFGALMVPVALADAGDVACWGLNQYGESDVPKDLGTPENPVASVAAGDNHSMALLVDGSMRCWGYDFQGQCQVPSGIGTPDNPAASVAAGIGHSIAVMVDGSIACWGRNSLGQCDVPSGVGTPANPVVEAAGGGAHTVALLADGSVTAEDADAMKTALGEAMEAGFEEAKSMELSVVDDFLSELWENYRPAEERELTSSPKTGVAKKKLVDLATRMSTLPEDKKFFRKVKKLMKDRLAMVERDELDWAMGEKLAYATLLEEGHPVRISGQDVERGTFSHRHAVVKTEDSEEELIMLNHLSKDQAKLQIYNSLLSEYAVSGFEYGYAFAQPDGLTIWEAQFGDFNNGAQIMWDQFLSAGEDKWRTMNGLTLLLPHGYEGMGSEHSSGRMERFLQLGSGDNLIVANCTTPANMFHVLRRQVHRPFRKPLVVFTPKKLLRYPKAVSSMADLSTGGFQEVIDDPKAKKGAEVVVLCSGKVYYDLLEKFADKTPKNMAVVRVEQLHPYPADAIAQAIGRHGNPKVVWLQEEPRNMGAWSFIHEQLHIHGHADVQYVGRGASASPASGSPAVHQQRHDALLEEVVAMAKF